MLNTSFVRKKIVLLVKYYTDFVVVSITDRIVRASWCGVTTPKLSRYISLRISHSQFNRMSY